MRKKLRILERALLAATFLVAHGFAVSATEFRRAGNFEDAHAASCRVSVADARGTGFFIGAIGKNAYVMTNYHVVTRSREARLDFWTNGRQESIHGQIDGRYFNAETPADFATVVVDADELKKIDPPFLALGGADAKPSIDATIVSSGAPDGRFPQAWKGRIIEYFNDKTAVFSPPPVPGQSGSPICEFVDGELFVTGILTWLLGEKGQDDSKGGAIPIMNLYLALARPRGRVDIHSSNASPIPPGAKECANAAAKAETGARDKRDINSGDETPNPPDASMRAIEEDFRSRAPIREFSDDVRIFEDSERRWRNRGKNQTPPRRETPPQENEGQENDLKARPSIGEKLTDGALDALSKKFEAKLAERIDAVKRGLYEKWNAVKYGLFMAICLTTIVARLAADAFVRVLKFSWTRLKAAILKTR